MRPTAAWSTTVLFALVAPFSRAQDREDVTFSLNATTVFGESIFVLGDLPELGGNDLRFAPKLEPSTYPVWKATISLPVNRAYTYRYYKRNDAAGQWGNPSNGVVIAGPFNASTQTVTLTPASKTIFYHSSLAPPVLWWRQGSDPFQSITMHDVGPGRSAGESRWAARRFGVPRHSFDFYFTNLAGASRDPASGSYTTALDESLVQDGHVFTYLPPASVTGPIKRYTPIGAPPTTSSTSLVSAALGETRYFRVITPRGYDQQPMRRYPVLYFHDGQNVFEQGAFGTWNADETAESMIRLGQMREVILVGADHGPDRINDYAAPDTGGRAHLYAQFLINELRPIIDTQYRTLTDTDNTAAAGSSMGGQVSMYLGWDSPTVFGRIGAFSGAWDVFNANFRNRLQTQPKRAIRVYLDSGDAGPSADGFWTTVGVRDNLINPARAAGVGGAYVLERDLRYVYGPGHQHNEPAWAARLPQCYTFLFPASEAPNELAEVPSAARADVNDDERADIEDVYSWEQASPGADSTLDVDRDGLIESAEDRAELLVRVRAAESADVAAF